MNNVKLCLPKGTSPSECGDHATNLHGSDDFKHFVKQSEKDDEFDSNFDRCS